MQVEILFIHVHDIVVVTSNDEDKINKIKGSLNQGSWVTKTFLRIEVAKSKNGIVISHKKKKHTLIFLTKKSSSERNQSTLQ